MAAPIQCAGMGVHEFATPSVGNGGAMSSLRKWILLCSMALMGLVFTTGCTIEERAYEPPSKSGSLQPPEVDLSVMVAIAGGSFSMGHPPADPGMYGAAWKENEMPEHEVTLSPFWVDKTEVTAEAFAVFLSGAAGEKHFDPLMPIERDGAYAYRAIEGRENRPANHVSWLAASEYCQWVGKRLPTEAEWERVAKGTDGRRWPWGDEGPNCQRANHYRGSSYCEGHPVDVGSTSPEGDSVEGAQDMAGNVAEWVADLYAPYAPDPVMDPAGPAEGWWRTVRGGGYNEAGAAIRTTARWAAEPTAGSPGIGFRCAVGNEGEQP